MPGILRFVSMLCLIFENGIYKETVPAILRYISLRFLIFEQALFTISKGDKEKNCPRFFRTYKYPFFNIWKRYKQKTVSIFRFMRMLFLIFENGTRKKLP